MGTGVGLGVGGAAVSVGTGVASGVCVGPGPGPPLQPASRRMKTTMMAIWIERFFTNMPVIIPY